MEAAELLGTYVANSVTWVLPLESETLKSVDVNKVNSALYNHQDKSEEQWHKTLSDFAKSEKPHR